MTKITQFREFSRQTDNSLLCSPLRSNCDSLFYKSLQVHFAREEKRPLLYETFQCYTGLALRSRLRLRRFTTKRPPLFTPIKEEFPKNRYYLLPTS